MYIYLFILNKLSSVDSAYCIGSISVNRKNKKKTYYKIIIAFLMIFFIIDRLMKKIIEHNLRYRTRIIVFNSMRRFFKSIRLVIFSITYPCT